MYLDESSVIMMLDSIYPNVVESAASTFQYLVQSPDTMAPELVDHIANTRQNYVPWYTAIQDNINAAKQEASGTISGSIMNFKADIITKMEAAHDTMVMTITGNGCNSYTMYEQEYISKLMTLMSTMSMGFWAYSGQVSGSIPTNMVMTLSTTIQNALYTYGSPVPMLTLVKQVRTML